MSREEYYLSASLIREISNLNIFIEYNACRQMDLVDANKLSQIAKDTETGLFKEDEIIKLWQMAFIQADVVKSTHPLEIEGLILLHVEDDIYCYADERTLKEKKSGYSDALSELEEFSDDINLLFHPFRCYILYHINRTFEPSISPMQMLSSKYFDKLTSWLVDCFNNWTSKHETIEVFRHWNTITSLCAVAEPVAHRSIFHRVRWKVPDSYEAMTNKLNAAERVVHDLFNKMGEKAIEYYRGEICRDAEFLDPNKNLHLIIRLMDTDDRKKLQGHIDSSMLFLYMAESLRRNLEKATGKEYPEEDERGFGVVFREAKKQLQGHARVLDGDRITANQFLRRFGLDYGTRVNIYVEGETEFGALSTEFAHNSSVLIINLRGNFVAGKGKGLSFRNSLLNDIKSKTFSLILLDGDLSDNYRVLKKAAEFDEICGMFFISNPDFEMANFKIGELIRIVFDYTKENHNNIQLREIEEATREVTSGKQFLERLNTAGLSTISKGQEWGRLLLSYAVNNPINNFGDEKDRIINQVIRVANQCCSYTYESTRQNLRVDPETGRLINRVKK